MKLWDLLTRAETPRPQQAPPKGVVVEVWLTRPDGEIYSRHCELLKFGGVYWGEYRGEGNRDPVQQNEVQK